MGIVSSLQPYLFFFCLINSLFFYQIKNDCRALKISLTNQAPSAYLQNPVIQNYLNFKSNLRSHTLNGQKIEKPIQPVGKRLLIKPNEPLEKSIGGVLLPSENRAKQIVGQVIAVGSGNINELTGVNIPLDANVGDWIIFSRNNYEELKYDGGEYGLISYENILAKIEGKTSISLENITPVRDKLLIKIKKANDKTESGLILSHKKQNDHYGEGEVISVGPGAYDYYGKRLPMEVSQGDTIKFNIYAIDESQIKLGSDKYSFISLDDVMAKW